MSISMAAKSAQFPLIELIMYAGILARQPQEMSVCDFVYGVKGAARKETSQLGFGLLNSPFLEHPETTALERQKAFHD